MEPGAVTVYSIFAGFCHVASLPPLSWLSAPVGCPLPLLRGKWGLPCIMRPLLWLARGVCKVVWDGACVYLSCGMMLSVEVVCSITPTVCRHESFLFVAGPQHPYLRLAALEVVHIVLAYLFVCHGLRFAWGHPPSWVFAAIRGALRVSRILVSSLMHVGYVC
jgi:hypothetical protein